MKEARISARLQASIAVVNGIIAQVCADHTSLGEHGLTYAHHAYEVWVTHQKKMILVQSLTGDMIVHCTDPDEETALKFQAFIEQGIRRGIGALIANSPGFSVS